MTIDAKTLACLGDEIDQPSWSILVSFGTRLSRPHGEEVWERDNSWSPRGYLRMHVGLKMVFNTKEPAEVPCISLGEIR